MEVPTVNAERRTQLGTKFARGMRAGGRLPGILYGHGETPEPFSISAHEFELHVHHGVRLLNLNMSGTTTQCLIKEIAYDHLDKDPVHIDLARVDLTEKVQVEVAIELKGTPKGAAHGGILEQLLDSIEVECLASQIPDTLHPSVSALEVGGSLTVADLVFPPGVQVLRDPEEKIAMVRQLTAAAEGETPEGEEAGSAEPERIGRPAAEDEESEGS